MTDPADTMSSDTARMGPPILVAPSTDGMPVLVDGRNYVYEVAVDGGRQIAYADDVTGVLEMLIPGYGHACRGWEDAQCRGDRNQVQHFMNVLFEMRAGHARTVRASLQAEVNEVARLLGAWAGLTAVEKAQCLLSAAGDVPEGVHVDAPFIDPDGREVLVETSVWSSSEVALVVDRADYDLFAADGAPEPESTLPQDMDGYAPNLAVLDSTSEWEYLMSLDRVGWVDVATYSPEGD